MTTWKAVLRPDLLDLRGYEHAAPERGVARLHANELPQDAHGDDNGLNRYPQPDAVELRERMAAYYGCSAASCLPTRGSDDAIDLLVRAFCRARRDSILISPPTFGIYANAARLQDAAVVEVPADPARSYRPEPARILEAADETVRLVFLCSPNNPTGVALDGTEIRDLAEGLYGRALLVVDEAYIEFTDRPSLATALEEVENLVVLRTLSKAFGVAGIRCGALLTRADLVVHLRRMMPPYPFAAQTLSEAVLRLRPEGIAQMRLAVGMLLEERARLAACLADTPAIDRVWPSEGNFLLVETNDEAPRLARALRNDGILVREISRVPNGLRITVGRPDQNDHVIGIAASLGRALSA